MASVQVGWIGLGSMGIGMSKNLQNKLTAIGAPPLVYTNRTLSRGEPLKALGGVPVETVTEVARKSSIIFSCVSNDAVLKETAEAIIASGDISGKIFADCSTVHPDTSVVVSKMVTEAGGQFISAPVFGASTVAEAGKLVFSVAGPAQAIEAISPYLKDVMGRAVINMGEDVAKSALLKIAGNICVVSFMEVISETQVFAEKTGLGTDTCAQMLGEIFGPVIDGYTKRLTTGAYAPAPGGKAGFDVALSIKDARHALNCAESAGARLETSEVALKNMETAQKLQPGKPLDSSSMYGAIRVASGLDFYTDLCKARDAAK
ncbi:hypothetical protein G7054_g6835 [Neopestalotiopsis clavispora]|nr:hypothetical protein G7054_g6835 [Neopestalotiopsis clavispora]